MGLQVRCQQIRVDDDAVWHAARPLKQSAQGVAFSVGEMLLPQQGVAEGEPGRDAVLLRQGQRIPGIGLPKARPSAAPQAVRRGPVERAHLAPGVKPLPLLPEERQKPPIQLVKLKQPGEVVGGGVRCCVSFFAGHSWLHWRMALSKSDTIFCVGLNRSYSASAFCFACRAETLPLSGRMS